MSLGRATVLLVAALLLWACGSSTTLPAPDILSVTPNQVTVPRHVPPEQRTSVSVSLDAVIPVRVDYGGEQAHTDAARVWIGSEEAAVQALDTDGTLIVEVPEALDKGRYDVRVTLADGREALRESVLTLIPKERERQTDEPDAGLVDLPDGGLDAGPLILLDAGLPDAGTERPDAGPGEPMGPGDVTGFQLEAVGDQLRGTPFLVIVRALGPRAAHFQEGVELTLNKNGTVSPVRLGPFIAGVCGQLVIVDANGGNMKLTVTDTFGAQGTSNGFKVK